VDEQDVEESPVEGGVDGDVRSELVEVRGDREGVDDAGEEGEGGSSSSPPSRSGADNWTAIVVVDRTSDACSDW